MLMGGGDGERKWRWQWGELAGAAGQDRGLLENNGLGITGGTIVPRLEGRGGAGRGEGSNILYCLHYIIRPSRRKAEGGRVHSLVRMYTHGCLEGRKGGWLAGWLAACLPGCLSVCPAVCQGDLWI